jgi:plasmid stability protein
MSIRTTLTLDDDVAAKVKLKSQSRGATFRDTVNDLLRHALVATENPAPRRTLQIRPSHSGTKPGLNDDSIASLLEYGEGDWHR